MHLTFDPKRIAEIDAANAEAPEEDGFPGVGEDMLFNFSVAFGTLKYDPKATMTREAWKNPCIKVKLQTPDENSKMTEPYLYMSKGQKKYPWQPSCVDLLADDWRVV